MNTQKHAISRKELTFSRETLSRQGQDTHLPYFTNSAPLALDLPPVQCTSK